MSLNTNGRDGNGKGILCRRKTHPLFKAKVFETDYVIVIMYILQYVAYILDILMVCIFIITLLNPKHLLFYKQEIFETKFFK